MKSNSRFNAHSVYSLCGIAMLGGVMFDYSTGVISGTVDSIQAHFHLASTQTGWVVSSMFVGCIIGSLIAGNLAARLGRKLVLLLATLALGISAVGSTFADSFIIFSSAHIVAGLGLPVMKLGTDVHGYVRH